MTACIPTFTRVGLRRTRRIPLPETDHRPVATARHRARTTLDAWGLPSDVVDTAELVVSELVTNACRYAPGPVAVRLTLRCTDRGGGELTIACRDTDPHPPPFTTDDPDIQEQESGRGLAIIAALCHGHGCTPAHGHKTIWAALTVPAEVPQPDVPVTRRGRVKILRLLPARPARRAVGAA